MLYVLHRNGLVANGSDNNGALFFDINDDGLGGYIVTAKNISGETGVYTINAQALVDSDPLPVYFSVSTGKFIEYKDTSRRRDSDSFMNAHNFASLAFSLVKFNGDLFVIFGQDVCVLCDADVRKAQNGLSTIRVVEQIAPDIAKSPRIIARRAKYDVIYAINPLDSVSDLEKQVDLLSELVLSIATFIPEENRPALIQKIESVMQHASTRQKTIEDCVNDVIKQKSHVRQQLATYYAVKANA